MKRTTIFIPSELDLRAESKAKRLGISKAELIRKALTDNLDADQGDLKERIPWLGSVSFPKDGVDSTNIKAWIREQYAKKANART